MYETGGCWVGKLGDPHIDRRQVEVSDNPFECLFILSMAILAMVSNQEESVVKPKPSLQCQKQHSTRQPGTIGDGFLG